ncbi:hypothetical protein NM688_g5291 [Phlebia brevispora]|uniref:Uncharacterized protein n=1 Tax=Phlebia brevispora TaxID=194682 RepID=A0ACC1SXX1_9APHY|nr:hypothetical protein NM688_g5291 [Phlebia brevispora]
MVTLEAIIDVLAHEIDPLWNIKITLIEMGSYDTSAIDNVVRLPVPAAYTAPSTPAAQIRSMLDNLGKSGPEGVKLGDSQKAVRKIYELSMLDEPPLRLILGKDAIGHVRMQIESVTADMEKYESWSEDLLLDYYGRRACVHSDDEHWEYTDEIVFRAAAALQTTVARVKEKRARFVSESKRTRRRAPNAPGPNNSGTNLLKRSNQRLQVCVLPPPHLLPSTTQLPSMGQTASTAAPAQPCSTGQCPIQHTPAQVSTSAAKCPIEHAPTAAPALAQCPVGHDGVEINPHNQMPLLSQSPVLNQSTHLPTDRTVSSIPRDEAARWEYPSPQQFHNALVRKGWETPEEHVETMVQIHNFLNEAAWQEILRWEKKENPAEDPLLTRFKGRPGELSPKARFWLFAGWLLPSRFNSEPPFDRHDWIVKRKNSGEEVRYVIDYYSAPPEPDGSPVFSLDVRPALDSFGSIKQRVSAATEEMWASLKQNGQAGVRNS